MANKRGSIEFPPAGFERQRSGSTGSESPTSPVSVSGLRALADSRSRQDYFPAGGLTFLEQATDLNLKGLPGLTESDVRTAFKEIDFDKNGFVGAGELRYMLMLLGEHPTDAELDEMLRMADCADNGQAAYADFRSILNASSPVPAEMANIVSMLREANAPTAEEIAKQRQEETAQTGKHHLDGPSVKDMDLMLKVASGFMHNLSQQARGGEARTWEGKALGGPGAGGQNMPPVHSKKEGARRARPQKADPPLSLSPRAAREARRFGTPAADPKGKGKGKDAGKPRPG